MKRSISFLGVLAIIAAVIACAETPKQIKKSNAPDRQHWQNEDAPLYGDVESVTMTHTRGGNSLTSIYYFNDEGHVKEIIRKNNETNESIIEAFSYDSYGNEVEHIMPDGGSIITQYKYDSFSNIQEKNSYANNVLLSQVIYTYDSCANLIETRELSISLFDNSYRETKTCYKYDKNGNKIEESDHWGCTYFKYDESNNLIMKEESYGDIYIYQYDLAGNLTETSQYNSEGVLCQKVVQKYDLDGNWIEISNYGENNTFEGKGVFKYDAMGNIIDLEYQDQNGDIKEKVIFEITYRK